MGDMDLLPGQSTSLRARLPIMIIAHLTIMMTVIHCIGWMIQWVGMRVISGKKTDKARMRNDKLPRSAAPIADQLMSDQLPRLAITCVCTY